MHRAPDGPRALTHKDAAQGLTVHRTGVRQGRASITHPGRARSRVTPEAVAFWVRAPGVGELRRRRFPNRATARCSSAPSGRASAAGPRLSCSAVEVPADQYAQMRAPFQEGDFPGPVKYGYLNVGVVEQGPGDARRDGPCSASTPTSRATWCPPPPWSRCRTACRPSGRSWPGTVETAVNALWDAPPLVGDRVSVVGAGMVGCCVATGGGGHTRGSGDPRRRRPESGRPSRRRWGSRSRAPPTRPATRTSSSTPPRPRPGCRPACGPARAGDVGARPQLVRRPRGPALPRRPVPLGPAGHPGQPGRDRLARRGPAAGRMPTGCGSLSTCSRTRRSTRSSPGRPRSRSCPR